MKEYDLASYATYKVLHALDESKGGYVPKSRYYKAIYLVSYNLMSREIDICLPWRWYIYGPIVELDCIDNGAFSLEVMPGDANDEAKDRLFYGEEPQVDAPYEIVRSVDNEVKAVCANKPKSYILLDKAYNTAPLPFIQVLRHYDDNIRSYFKKFNCDPTVINRNEDLRYDLIREFPIEPYRPMYDSFLRVLELIRVAKDPETFDIVKPTECSKELRTAMGNGFGRDYYSKHLPEYKVEKYKRDYERHVEIFDDFTFNKEIEFYRATSRHDCAHYEREIMNLLG